MGEGAQKQKQASRPRPPPKKKHLIPFMAARLYRSETGSERRYLVESSHLTRQQMFHALIVSFVCRACGLFGEEVWRGGLSRLARL